MNKIAIFVEGQTEQIFIERLIQYLGSEKKFAIQKERTFGGSKGKSRLIEIIGMSEVTHQDYLILICDCGNDSRVKSDINERYDGLIRENYQIIIGIRDVLPILRNDIDKLRRGLSWHLRSDPVEPLFILAIMEIEAWFLAEHSHFVRIHPKLTVDWIKQNLGFDPSVDDMQLRNCPSKDLEDIYFLGNVEYHKTRQHVERIINTLDFYLVTQVLALRISDLRNLVNTIEHFFTTNTLTKTERGTT